MKKVITKAAITLFAAAALLLLAAAATGCNSSRNLVDLKTAIAQTAENENLSLDLKIKVEYGEQSQWMSVYAARSAAADRAAIYMTSGGVVAGTFYLRGKAADLANNTMTNWRDTTLNEFWGSGDALPGLGNTKCEVAKTKSGKTAVYTVKITDKKFIEEQFDELGLILPDDLEPEDVFTYKYTVGENGCLQKYAYDFTTTVRSTRITIAANGEYKVGDAVLVRFPASVEGRF